MEKRPLYRRRQYFVRKRFQLKYIGLILAVVFISASVSGYTIYYNAWVLLGEKLAAVYPQGMLVHIFRSVNMKLLINIIFVSIFCAGVGIMASHRIAGPVFRMIKFLDSASEGDYKKRIQLRKGDELADLADAMNRLMDKLENEKKS